MKKIVSCIVLVLGLYSFQVAHAQGDLTSWSSVGLNKQWGKSSLQLKPILRHNNDLGSYDNFSIDLIYKRNLGKGFHVQGLTRRWFLQDNVERQFWWFDIGKSWNTGNSQVFGALRVHHAVDLDDRFDGDFLRFKIGYKPAKWGKVQASIFSEFWYQINDDLFRWHRIRNQANIGFPLGPKVSAGLGIWYEPFLFTNRYTINLLPGITIKI